VEKSAWDLADTAVKQWLQLVANWGFVKTEMPKLQHAHLLVSVEVLESDDRRHLWMQSTWVKSKRSTSFFGTSFASMLVRVIIIQTFSCNH
jgi:hypothetical protein